MEKKHGKIKKRKNVKSKTFKRKKEIERKLKTLKEENSWEKFNKVLGVDEMNLGNDDDAKDATARILFDHIENSLIKKGIDFDEAVLQEYCITVVFG